MKQLIFYIISHFDLLAESLSLQGVLFYPFLAVLISDSLWKNLCLVPGSNIQRKKHILTQAHRGVFRWPYLHRIPWSALFPWPDFLCVFQPLRANEFKS
jgi:hypothetical protein